MVKTLIPKTLKEALVMISETSALPFSGGTDLMVKYKSWSGALPVLPKDVIYIGDLKELKGIYMYDGEISIGSAVKLSSIISQGGIPEYIKQPVGSIGSPSIRNQGTMGGNICNASPAGDTLPMLYALDAKLEVASVRGTKLLNISELITGPGKTSLEQDELVTRIIVPKHHFNRWRFRKVGSRKSNAISKLSVFLAADVEDSSIRDIRITFGAVGPTIIRSRELEKEFKNIGLKTQPTDKHSLLESYKNKIKPISDVRSTKDYRSEVCIGILHEMIDKELRL